MNRPVAVFLLFLPTCFVAIPVAAQQMEWGNPYVLPAPGTQAQGNEWGNPSGLPLPPDYQQGSRPCCNDITQPLGPQSLPAPPQYRSYVPAPPYGGGNNGWGR